jgi:hypothetical protein
VRTVQHAKVLKMQVIDLTYWESLDLIDLNDFEGTLFCCLSTCLYTDEVDWSFFGSTLLFHLCAYLWRSASSRSVLR